MTDLRLADGETLVVELNDVDVDLVLAGLDRLVGDDRTDTQRIEVLAAWIRYRIAQHQRPDAPTPTTPPAIPTESPAT